MVIIVAPDSFKGSVKSVTAAEAISRGARKVFPDARIIQMPVADGGEGTAEAFLRCAGGTLREHRVTGPLGDKITAGYAFLPDGTAVIELAAASGLTLVPAEKRNPMLTTSYGTGELIRHALENGAKTIVAGLGGSATNDGGMGLAQALGVSFRDEYGNELGFGGGELHRLRSIDISGIHPFLADCRIIAACDVTNPLCGESGASAVYGPQKGASPSEVRHLDGNLRHYASVIKEQLGIDILFKKGSGASGGAGAALMAFLGAEFRSGIETVLDAAGFDQHLAGADLVITGEGRVDGQSACGKVLAGIGARAKKYRIPVLAMTGCAGEDAQSVYDCGIDGLFCITDRPMPLEEAMNRAEELLENAAERMLRIFKTGMMMNDRL